MLMSPAVLSTNSASYSESETVFCLNVFVWHEGNVAVAHGCDLILEEAVAETPSIQCVEANLLPTATLALRC